MGQCYRVDAKFKFKNNDSTSFCEAVRKEAKERFASYNAEDYDTPYKCFQIITSKDSYESDDGVWHADFDASYSWMFVMCDIFEATLSLLADGSWVKIYPDNGKTTYRVKGGKVYERSVNYE